MTGQRFTASVGDSDRGRGGGRREVEVSPALATALAGDPDARAIFDGLAPSHRREYARWIAEAKREDTRTRRAERALVLLRQGTDTPGGPSG